MANIVSKIKDTVANIDIKQIKEDVKTEIKYLDMGTILGRTALAIEKIDVGAIKEKVNDFRNGPIVEKVENTAKSAADAAVVYVSRILKK